MPMRSRIVFAHFLIRAGRFLQSLAVMAMRPRDLLEFNRRTYASPRSVEGWAEENLVNAGLSDDEKLAIEAIPLQKGALLLLGVGGGREAIPLAERGFDVTGVDFIPDLVERAKQNALRRGFTIKGLVQDIAALDLPEESCDVVWLGGGAYSSVPTRKKRGEMLKRIHGILRPGGYLFCQFLFDPEPEIKRRGESFRKIFAWITLGNIRYERGDRLAGQIEFAHFFSSEKEVRAEFTETGFDIVDLRMSSKGHRGNALLKKIK